MFTAMAHGLRCTSELSIPFLTEAYQKVGDIFSDKFEDSVIELFPFTSEHAIAWSKRVFKRSFVELSTLLKEFVRDPHVLSIELEKTKPSPAAMLLKEYLLNPMSSSSFRKCLMVGKFLFRQLFITDVFELLSEYPPTYKENNSQKLFWLGYKKKPTPLELSLNDELSVKFIVSTGKLLAHVLKIQVPDNTKDISVWLLEGIDKNEEPIKKDLEAEISKFELEDKTPGDIKLEHEGAHRNVILDFLWSATNLRARCYTIHELPRYKVEKLALRVKINVPLVISVIVGLSCLEIIKWIQKKPLESYKNHFLNLGITSFVAETPQRPKRKIIESNFQEFTTWDKIILIKDDKVKDLINAVKNKFGGQIKSIFYKTTLLYQISDGESDQNEDQTLVEQLEAKVPSFDTVRVNRKSLHIEYSLQQDYSSKILPVVKLLL